MKLTGRKMLERFEQVLVFGEEEMERRWALARQVMQEQEADYLIVLEGSYEGYNHWFMGNRECEAILVPKEGNLIVVLGREVSQEEVYQPERPVNSEKWIARKPVQPVHSNLRFVDTFDARDILSGCEKKSGLRIAMIHPEVLKNTWYENMKAVLGEFICFDIGLALDAVRVIKGEEETYLIRQVNKMNEKLMAAAGQIIRPGRSLKEITDEFQYLAMRLGSGGHFVHVFCLNCGPQDEPSADGMARRPYPGLVMQQGDKVFVLIETNGPGGHYSALGRYCILGEPSAEMKRYWDMAVKAQKNAAKMMKPGVSVREIADKNYEYITGCGFLTNQQNYLHSLGFQYGEQPYLNAPSENTPLQAGMHYIAHPVIQRPYPGTDAMDGIFALDTYFVTEEGGVRANDFPQELIVLPH
ncbi:MAG: M24 family metallopeptidase [Candidatus Limivivens sp.]|nr:M24 family metallopeptidase [Candidatus Limivivens sp.]